MVLELWSPGGYEVARWLLLRGVAFVYLLAFLNALRQYRPLAGEHGLMPLDSYRSRWKFRERPSLFYYVRGDRWIAVAAFAGVLGSLAAFLGLPGFFDGWTAIAVHVALWLTLWTLYLSFANAGQTFYGYGWESMLTETGFLCVFLGPPSMAAPAVTIWLFRWLLFRNMFGAGLIKLRGDSCWRDLTCLDYHYETQPMPNPVSWYVHHAPRWFHRFGVATNHFVELFIPVLYFAPKTAAAAAGAVTVGFMAWLMLSGNFSWLNFLTMVQAFSLFEDAVLEAALPLSILQPEPAPTEFTIATYGLLALVAVLSFYPVRNMLSPRQRMNASFDPFNLVNTYGAFGSITKTRYEVVVEATRDDMPVEDADWRPYLFYGKPTDVGRRPPQVAPYHHRLDWQMWFAAMTASPQRCPWFVHMTAKLLAGDEAIEGLFREVPFEEEPPRFVRAVRYRYRYTTPEERRESGDWWRRERDCIYYGPVSADDPGLRRQLRSMGWTETVEELDDLVEGG